MYRLRDQLRAVVADDGIGEDAKRVADLLAIPPPPGEGMSPHRRLAAIVVEIMKVMTSVERRELYEDISYRYCIHCGDEQPATWSCQCTNDE